VKHIEEVLKSFKEQPHIQTWPTDVRTDAITAIDQTLRRLPPLPEESNNEDDDEEDDSDDDEE